MGIEDILFRVMAGTVIGFTIGLSGVGGGVLILPTLVSVFGLSPSLAVGTASFYTVLTKVYATIEHFRKKNIEKNVGMMFLYGAIPGVIGASILINMLVHKYAAFPHTIDMIQQTLRWSIISVMAVSSVLILLNAVKKKNKPSAVSGISDAKRNLFGILLGFLVGVLIGATSIGGGVIVIPILILFFKLSGSTTVGTSIFIAVVLSFLATIIYGRSGQIDFITGLIMFAGSTVGVYLGAKACTMASDRFLKITLFLLISVSIGMMFLGHSGH